MKLTEAIDAIESRKIRKLLQSTTGLTSLEVLELHENVNCISQNQMTHAELRKNIMKEKKNERKEKENIM